MSLKEVIEETKKQIEEAEKAEEAAVAPAEEVKEEPKEAPKEEVKEESKPEEPVEEPKKTPAQYAKERKDNAKLRNELDAANALIAKLAQPKTEPVKTDEDAEPNSDEDPQAWNAWNIRNLKKANKELADSVTEIRKEKQTETLKTAAEREMVGYENETRGQYKDYDDAKRYYANMLAYSVKVLNPSLSNDKLVEIVNHRMLTRASELMNEGHGNPVAAMYEEAKTLGYKAAAPENTKEEILKPDLSKVAANRARNAGTAAAGSGRGDGELTAAHAATMTNAEFAKLKPEERQRLFAQASGR